MLWLLINIIGHTYNALKNPADIKKKFNLEISYNTIIYSLFYTKIIEKNVK